MGGNGAASLASAAAGAILIAIMAAAAEADWCVARSSASPEALQTALNYACSSGADCAPIQPSGLCFLPNSLQAHASYAFNSYYQRRNYAAGSCDFAGTATTTIGDPSFGSCTYPSSPSSAGSAPATNITNVVPTAAVPSTTKPPWIGSAATTSAAVPPLAAHHLAFSAAAAFLLA